jgi:hypothetical protein
LDAYTVFQSHLGRILGFGMEIGKPRFTVIPDLPPYFLVPKGADK